MKLILDLSVSKVAKVCLVRGGSVIDEQKGADPLVILDELLTKHQLSLADLEEIVAVPGPGSFTGLKVGAAIVDALNYSLGKSARTKLVYVAKNAAPGN